MNYGRFFLFYVFLCLLIFSPLMGITNNPPEEQPKVIPSDSNQNIVFESYDEVIMQNYEKQNITQIKFVGNVKISFENNKLKARTVIITSTSNKITDISAYDKVEFHYGSDIYLADFMSFNPSTKKGFLKNVRSFVKSGDGSSQAGPISTTRGWFYRAKKATILSDKRVVLEDVHFTFTPAEYPYYYFYAQRLWYFKGDLIFALNNTYTVGGANFLYFPFFLRWERATGIKTAFGQEKRIGWYLMNTLNIDTPEGSYIVGLDLYEKLGQYLTTSYTLRKPFGTIQSFSINFQGANDIRTFYDTANDRYTHIDPNNSQYSNIQQLSWQYTVNMGLKFNDITLDLFWEDLNDPFFVSKYRYRRNQFDVKEVLQPFNNQFFLHNDQNIEKTYIERGFNLKSNNLGISGKWGYILTANPEVSNIYLNERYKYKLTNIQFPHIDYNTGNIDILKDISYTFPSSKKIEVSNQTYEIPIEADENKFIDSLYSKPKSEITNLPDTITEPGKETPSNKTISYRISTNNYELYSFSSYINANFIYRSYEYVDTNSIPTSDLYYHIENGSYAFNGEFLNKLLYWNNSVNFENSKYWSSFSKEYTNNINQSGLVINLGSTLGLRSTPSIFTGSFWQINFPYTISHGINYQVYNSKGAFLVANPLETSHTTSASWGFNLLNNNINYSLSANHQMRFRQTNNVDDNYINNMIGRTLSVDTGLSLFWIKFSTGTSLDLLETKDRPLIWTFDELTNRILPGHNPKLTVTFAPSPAELYQPMPSFTYVYDILKKTNESFSINSTYSIKDVYPPFLYKIESLNFTTSLRWDFLSPRSTIFNMSFSTIIWLDRYWRMAFATSVVNSRIYRYFEENEPYFSSGEYYVDFWQNLLDSINIFDYEALKRGFFKIQDLHFDLTHYLNEWEMHIQFNLSRRVDNTRMVAYWEPSIRIEFILSGTSDQFPPYEKKFVPEQYQ